MATPRMEDSRVEDAALAPRLIVTGGQRGPGPGHLTHSARGEVVICPGPLHRVCSSLEDGTAGRHLN